MSIYYGMIPVSVNNKDDKIKIWPTDKNFYTKTHYYFEHEKYIPFQDDRIINPNSFWNSDFHCAQIKYFSNKETFETENFIIRILDEIHIFIASVYLHRWFKSKTCYLFENLYILQNNQADHSPLKTVHVEKSGP